MNLYEPKITKKDNNLYRTKIYLSFFIYLFVTTSFNIKIYANYLKFSSFG